MMKSWDHAARCRVTSVNKPTSCKTLSCSRCPLPVSSHTIPPPPTQSLLLPLSPPTSAEAFSLKVVRLIRPPHPPPLAATFSSYSSSASGCGYRRILWAYGIFLLFLCYCYHSRWLYRCDVKLVTVRGRVAPSQVLVSGQA